MVYLLTAREHEIVKMTADALTSIMAQRGIDAAALPNSQALSPEDLEALGEAITDRDTILSASAKLMSANTFSVFEGAAGAFSVTMWQENRSQTMFPLPKRLADRAVAEGLTDEILTEAAAKYCADHKYLPEADLRGITLIMRVLGAETTVIEKKEPTSSTAKRPDTVPFPLDKLNSTVWRLTPEDTEGGLIPLKAEKAGSKKEVSILWQIDFASLGEDVKISRQLTPFDKRVHMAISALFDAGNNVVTLTSVHYAMGNSGRPNTANLQRINESVQKMSAASIVIDNTQEAKEYAYEKFVYKGRLLPIEQVEHITNGKLSESAIKLFREPPVVTFARQRRQITAFPLKVLQSPGSKTETAIALENYLLERIGKARGENKKANLRRILYDTIFDACGITDRKQRQRSRDKILALMNHFQTCGTIRKYTEDQGGITFFFS